MSSDTSTPTFRAAALPERDAATYLAVSTALLRKWRLLGGGPAYARLGRTVRYRPNDLDAFLAARIVTREVA